MQSFIRASRSAMFLVFFVLFLWPAALEHEARAQTEFWSKWEKTQEQYVGLGVSVSDLGDVDGDGYPEFIASTLLLNRNKIIIYSGRTLLRLYELRVDNSTIAAQAIKSIKDLDGDGCNDFIAGAHGYSKEGSNNIGRVYVYSGAEGVLIYTFDGEGELNDFGYVVASAGDVNGDGFEDILVGAPAIMHFYHIPGKAYVFSGRDGKPLYKLEGATNHDYFGYAVAGLGDLDKDGYADFAVGAPEHVFNYGSRGKVYIYSGKTGKLTASFPGEYDYEHFGMHLVGPGDLDRDGSPDIVVGASGYGSPLNEVGRIVALSIKTGKRIFTVTGEQHGESLPYAMTALPDIDGDEVPEILASSFQFQNEWPRQMKTVLLSGATGHEIYRISNLFTGFNSLSYAGDVNRDGIPDFLVGEPYAFCSIGPEGIIPGRVCLFSAKSLALHSPTHFISTSYGGKIPLFLNAGPRFHDRPYLILCSLSGLYPGTGLPGGMRIPLNWDSFTELVLGASNTFMFDGFFGVLDGEGKAQAVIRHERPMDRDLAGTTLTLVFFTLCPVDYVSNPLRIDVHF